MTILHWLFYGVVVLFILAAVISGIIGEGKKDKTLKKKATPKEIRAAFLHFLMYFAAPFVVVLIFWLVS